MKIVIKIPDYNLDDVQNGSIACGQILKAVRNGTPLPEGHGRLIDADKYKEHIFRVFPCDDADDRNIRRATELGLECAPTVVPADRRKKNEDSNI